LEEINFQKSRLFVSFFTFYFKRSLRRNFSKVFVKNLNRTRSVISKAAERNSPFVICANHSSWWDAAVILYLTYDVLRTDSYCIMEKKQFDLYPYFGKVGAIPVIREDARGAMQMLKETSEFLNRTGKSLWIFPQGEIIPNGKRPFHFYPGISYLLKNLNDAPLICSYLDYRFGKEQFPEVYIDFFEASDLAKPQVDARRFTNDLADKFGRQAEKFDLCFSNNDLNGFEILLKGRSSISDKAVTKFF
jgi:1-acyl-sn-glycerol-3-phosphate acyltransferase